MRKQAEILKSTAAGPTARDMELINVYTRRELSADEVYVFSVVLCDNEIDRDFERFTQESLYALEKLFLGKTGVFDHNPKAENQTARIYSLSVERVNGRKTAAGDDYYRLVAKAYLPKSEKTDGFILMLDSGIQKEVSVGCAVSRSVCSICGSERGGCSHSAGKSYNGRLCYFELLDPYDAYEWSFVAVPSQRNAGVIKAYAIEKEKNMEEILKAVKSGGELSLSAAQTKRLGEYIAAVEHLAEEGAGYRQALRDEVKRLAVMCEPEIEGKVLDSVVEKMSTRELSAYKSAYEKRLEERRPLKPQLSSKGETAAQSDNQFII